VEAADVTQYSPLAVVWLAAIRGSLLDF